MNVAKPVLRFFFDRLDVPIRIAYCHAPLIHKRFFWRLYSSNFEGLDRLFNSLAEQLARIDYSLEDKVCLELGPGNTYINAFNLLIAGARKVILVDKYPRNFDTKEQCAYFRKELDFVCRKYGVETLPFASPEGCDPERISVIAGDITRLEFNEQVDFVYSNSVLEHVRDIPGTLSALSAVMKQGAIAHHGIDMRDHFNFESPFLFYRYSSTIWEKYLTKEGVSYTNRLRYDEFEAEFRRQNLEILHADLWRYPLHTSNLSAPFRGKPEDILQIGRAFVLLRKV
ncbi:MAG: class I SAM-dependent methyltransferase [Candidatus Hydrogenedentes bacterium]|nr:class I SAM-dependent methyltransferase [Candidatus Hydrogenedentota bacterium]